VPQGAHLIAAHANPMTSAPCAARLSPPRAGAIARTGAPTRHGRSSTPTSPFAGPGDIGRRPIRSLRRTTAATRVR